MEQLIPFNKPYLTGTEIANIQEAIKLGHISGNGFYTKKCQTFFENKYGFKKTLLTTSCTDALEMCAMLLDVKEGDEVIIPSFTFVSTALAFVRQGAKIVFADSYHDNPNIDPSNIEALITVKTKVIVVVHYAGVACDMDAIMSIANKHNIFVVEDAAQAIESSYKGRQLGGIGHLGSFSFHETKNIQCGEGGLLIINDDRFIHRAEILWEKGTNRAEFFRGEVNKYGWVDTGSSFLPSELNSAFLYAQLENIDRIQQRRKAIWNRYFEELSKLESKGFFKITKLPSYATNNAHMFYIILPDLNVRTNLISHLKQKGILSVFHYLSLHKSDYYKSIHKEDRELPNSDNFSDTLLRLPLYYELSDEHQNLVIASINEFFNH
jgi:dTDP-4-amino-4,6-dideoxygalactose transaminase